MSRLLIAVALVACCAIGMVVCSSARGVVPGASSANTAAKLEAPDPDDCDPLRLVVIVDKSASTPASGTPDLTIEDLQPAFEEVARCGGELAVGVLGVASDRPLRRVLIPVPPTQPVLKAESPNPFIRKREAVARVAVFAAYDRSVTDQVALVEDRLNQFADEIEPVLTLPAVQQRSDVAGATRRAALWLGEPPSFARSRSRALFVTDGVDNVKGSFDALPPGTLVAVVNGTSKLGALSRLAPAPALFDNAAPAVAHLVAAERKIR